jgi:hypothetical protein
MHKDAQGCGRMLENIGEYRNMLKDAKKCRSTLEHVEGCKHGCKTSVGGETFILATRTHYYNFNHKKMFNQAYIYVLATL